MVNISLDQVDNIINKNYSVIKKLDNNYLIETYTPEIIVERGKYGFNIIPQSIVVRELTDSRDLDNLNIDVYMHYEMDAEEVYKTVWTEMMRRGQVIIDALYDKQNFPVGISTVSIGVDFDNPIVLKEKIIDLTFKCEYKIFATR